MAEDLFVLPLATQLLACLCAEVQNQPNPPLHCCYRVGVEIAHDAGPWADQCCEGIAYVALGDTYPSSDAFPEQDVIRQSNAVCSPPSWAQRFKVGIIRCAPVGQDDGSPPTCDDWNAAALQTIYDGLTLRRVQCCMREWVRANEGLFLGMSIVMERQVQGTPLGGCVERNFGIVVQFPNCDC